MSDTSHIDRDMAAQFERIIRRVKGSMSYRGSYSTRDILGSLVARWVQSGEWARLQGLPPSERKIGESVRRFLLDRLDQLRTRGERVELHEELVLPDEQTLVDLVEAAELRAWIDARVTELERGSVDGRVRVPLAQPEQVGRALRLQLRGLTQRRIASELGISLAVVHKRLLDGTNYLVVLQAIEAGLT